MMKKSIIIGCGLRRMPGNNCNCGIGSLFIWKIRKKNWQGNLFSFFLPGNVFLIEKLACENSETKMYVAYFSLMICGGFMSKHDVKWSLELKQRPVQRLFHKRNVSNVSSNFSHEYNLWKIWHSLKGICHARTCFALKLTLTFSHVINFILLRVVALQSLIVNHFQIKKRNRVRYNGLIQSCVACKNLLEFIVINLICFLYFPSKNSLEECFQ